MKKTSRKRDAILAAICSTKCHPTAEWIYNAVKPEYPDLSLCTVYRNIAMFKDEGSIICVGVVNGQERYDGCVKPHMHFVCDKCGAVIDVENPHSFSDDEMDKKISDAYDIDVDYHSIVFHGKCTNCR